MDESQIGLGLSYLPECRLSAQLALSQPELHDDILLARALVSSSNTTMLQVRCLAALAAELRRRRCILELLHNTLRYAAHQIMTFRHFETIQIDLTLTLMPKMQEFPGYMPSQSQQGRS